MKKIAILILLFLLFSCSKNPFENPPQTPEKQNPFEILKGETRFYKELGLLKDPKGILPPALKNSTDSQILLKEANNFYEFFVFDANSSLLILSLSPLYFIKIHSKDFYSHLLNEYKQIQNGKEADYKTANTFYFFKTVQDYEIGIFFTPKEIYYTNRLGSNRYIVFPGEQNITHIPDVWEFFEASSEITLYTPRFEEEQIFADFYQDQLPEFENKTRIILAGSKSSVFNYPNSYPILPVIKNFEFSFFLCRKLSQELLLKPYVNSADMASLTKDFALFFSVPLGNSKDSLNKKDFLSRFDGIGILIRGDLKPIMNFINQEGLDLEPTLVNEIEAGDLIVTEINWAGAYKADETSNYQDEWFEIKNTSSRYIDLSSISFQLIKVNLPDGTEEIKKTLLPVSASDMKYLAPGEYLVISRTPGTSSYLFYSENYPVKNLYSTSFCSGHGFEDPDSVKTFKLRILKNNTEYLTVNYSDSPAGINDATLKIRKSMVLNTENQWITSTHDIAETGNTSHAGKTFGTPGFSASGEK